MEEKKYRMGLRISLIIIISGFLFNGISGQDFYFGNDLSYVNQMEDCGAVFKEDMQPKDVYKIFADHGTNLVRVRLWVDPSWWQGPIVQPPGVKSYYNDLEDVKETIKRSKDEGMKIMLGIHYSDFWADPGIQLVPRGWLDVAYDLDALKDKVYNYTFNLLSELDSEGLMPEFIKVGNETNPGILKHIPVEDGYVIKETISNSWTRHAALFNSAILAIRDISSISEIKPEISIHFSGKLNTQAWNFQNLINNGVTDFDVIGISYYYAWHEGSISELETTIRSLKEKFPDYKVWVVETGYLWTTQNFDPLGNIINIPDPDYLPVIPEKQLEYMVDYTRAVMKGGGKGVVFWEPAWVSTPCKTPWGTGSSHDHVAFFDPVHTNFMKNGGGMWMQSPYYEDLETRKISFKVDMQGTDTSEGVYITGSFSRESWELIPMVNEGNSIFSYYTYLPSGSEGGFFFLNGPDWEKKENIPSECMTYQDSCRKYSLNDKEKVISLKWGECPGIVPDSVLVTFAVDMNGEDVSRGVYMTGHPTGDPWKIVRLGRENGTIYSWSTYLTPGEEGAYYFLTTGSWELYLEYRETVPSECAEWWGSDRGYTVSANDTVFGVKWGSCDTFQINTFFKTPASEYFAVFPNPTDDFLNIKLKSGTHPFMVKVFNLQGIQMETGCFSNYHINKKINVKSWPEGPYFCLITDTDNILFKTIFIKI